MLQDGCSTKPATMLLLLLPAADQRMLFVLLADGSLQVCVVSGPAIATVASLPLPGLNPSAERLTLHAWPHPVLPGGALVAVEAAKSGVTILEAPARWERGPGRVGWAGCPSLCNSRELLA